MFVQLSGICLEPAERAVWLEIFIKECNFLRRCVHPNFARFIGIVVDDEKMPLYLAMEYVPAGSLYEMLYRKPHRLLPYNVQARTPLFFGATSRKAAFSAKGANLLGHVTCRLKAGGGQSIR